VVVVVGERGQGEILTFHTLTYNNCIHNNMILNLLVSLRKFQLSGREGVIKERIEQRVDM